MPIVVKFESSTSARAQLRELTTEITRLKNEAKEVCVQALKELCEQIFSENPDIDQFAWVQYGGEYNDEGPYPGINEVLINDELESQDSYGLRSSHAKSDALQKQINDLGPDVLIEALGSYHQVEVIRGEGISSAYWDGY